MSSSASGVARAGSMYRPFHRSNSSSSSIENLPPRTLARVSKEVRELIKNPPEGVRLVVDIETGLPASLGEIVVRSFSVIGHEYGYSSDRAQHTVTASVALKRRTIVRPTQTKFSQATHTARRPPLFLTHFNLFFSNNTLSSTNRSRFMYFCS